MVEEAILAVWKYKEDADACDDRLVYQKACIEQVEVEELELIPVAEMMEVVDELFSSWTAHRDGKGFEKRGLGEIRISTTSQTVLLNCYEMDEDDLNALVDMAYERGCSYYDPVCDVRFGPFPV